MNAYTLDLHNILEISDRQFYDLCRQNPDVKFERNATGDLIIMAPTGGETGNRNIELAAEFVLWNRRIQLGYLFDSSTGFRLPGGGYRSPDLAWIAGDRWLALSPEQREKFPPIAPDFVLELRSPSDSLTDLQTKMAEYITSGVQLAWLIDRAQRTVTIYRPNLPPEVLPQPASLEGEPVLPGFQLDLSFVW
ncbi:Uma2 family endonuclease [Spirulina sp. CCNP1310]|uniref:Uma2 family endonuclease n=1 Tax=Spirulina sp. CCNP1310 TaxID=3110249 RepID=UPI002B1FEED7|nr:Uma2 family endonuclease [Spirulina sp. CCNP1310]MEA5418853.1 Uma2 family endonuclease [Spirulina sp. CCNP1310]